MHKSEQLNTEFRFSRRMKSFIVLDSFLNDEPTELMNYLADTISKWRDGKFFPEKCELVSRLPDTESIVYELMIVILSNFKYQAIQGLSIKLGSALGYKDMIDACKIGSSIIGLCHGDLYDIHYEDDGTFVNPLLRMDASSERRCRALCYMPPIKEKAPEWTSNVGGWLWEKQSVILGQGGMNHHWDNQALDVLNKVQKIAWVIDPDVLANEVNPNTEMDRSQFNEIVEDYIDEEFYFNWRYDKRGRMYASGYDLSPQSNEYGKALLSPSVGEVCTEEGLRALKISIAGHEGYDKFSWDEREKLFAVAGTFWKEPILGRKSIRTFNKAIAGEPINYFMQLDATASFAQIAAVITGCVKTGSLCNLVDTGKRENLYQTVHDAMADKLPVGSMDDVMTKSAVMCHTYNSKAEPKKAFDDDQLKVFYEVMKGLLPGAEDLKSLLNRTWNDSCLEHRWTMPDGHVCRVPVTEMEDIRIRVDELDGRRFTLRYSNNQSSKNYRSLAPNCVHATDSFVMREMIRRCSYDEKEVLCTRDRLLNELKMRGE